MKFQTTNINKLIPSLLMKRAKWLKHTQRYYKTGELLKTIQGIEQQNKTSIELVNIKHFLHQIQYTNLKISKTMLQQSYHFGIQRSILSIIQLLIIIWYHKLASTITLSALEYKIPIIPLTYMKSFLNQQTNEDEPILSYYSCFWFCDIYYLYI